MALIVLSGCSVIDEIRAYNLAKDEIEAVLKSPSTAEWPGLGERRTHINERQDVSGTAQLAARVGYEYRKWYVTSWVDAENGFGAMGRQYWAVRVTKIDDDWSAGIVSLSDDPITFHDLVLAE
jgi:hypothetical protein